MPAEKQRGKNGKIELLRFVFALIIMLFHFKNIASKNEGYFFVSGALAVEFFFILSGFLMMRGIDRRRAEPVTDLGAETVGFLAGKIKALFPEFLLAFVIGFTVRSLAEAAGLRDVVKLFVDSFWELLFLKQSGLQLKEINAPTWYISAMLICMAFQYPLLRKYPSLWGKLLLPLLSVLALGWLCQNYASPRGPGTWIDWTYKGTVRAFGEIGLGAFFFYLSKGLSQQRLTRLGKLTLTVLEPLLYALAIVYMYFRKSGRENWCLVPLLAAAIAITFSEQTFCPRILDNRVSAFLGRFSLPLYLGHHYWTVYLPDFLPKGLAWGQKYAIYIGVSLATAAAIWLLSALIRRYKLGGKLLRLFVAERASA